MDEALLDACVLLVCGKNNTRTDLPGKQIAALTRDKRNLFHFVLQEISVEFVQEVSETRNFRLPELFFCLKKVLLHHIYHSPSSFPK